MTLYTIPTTKRDYGKLELKDGTQLPDQIVQEGWAKVREDAGKKEDNEEALEYLDRLRSLEAQAKAESKGLWGKGGNIEVLSEVSDPNALVQQYKDQKLEAIVERVLTGDRMIARLLLSNTKHIQTMLVLAGVRTPATKRTSPEGKDVPAEPYGTEAHQFVEQRLRQRQVTVNLLGVTPQNQLIAHVLHPRGNIAIFLLEAGLARSNDQHVTLLGNDMAQFRKTETTAKNARKGLFTGTAAAKAAGPQDADFTVSRVLNGETIFLRTRSGEERKVTLSSIRQPKPSDPKQAPFGADAKEFMRKKLIGKHVKVSIDGKKPPSEGFEEREVATILVNGKNVALQLVEAGYASVIRHRRDDTDRSPDYDSFLLAEEAAQQDEKGMWSSKAPAAKQYQDYSESLAKAKMMASVMQRQKKVPAVVDFVRAGSRFVVLVPRENAKLTFVLSGIRTPKPARPSGEAAEPYGQEALEFASRRCMQRDVEIDVENTDKQGGFIGTLYVGRENFAKVLVEEGLAEVHAFSAEQSGHGNELFAAEKKAKEARKGLWHSWDPSQEASEDESATTTNGSGPNGSSSEPTTRRKDYRDLMVTHVDDDGKLKVQQIGSGTSSLLSLMKSFKQFHISPANSTPLPGPPKVGDVVAAKFTLDDDWYRAKVRRVDRDGQKADVTYIDYGNSETVPWKRLRPLTQSQFSLEKLGAQASDAVLSFVQLPTNREYLRDAIAYLSETTDGRELVANVDSVNQGVLSITLFDPKISTKPEESVNAEVIREGLGMVPIKLKGWERAEGEVLANLTKLQDEAKGEHRGMWEYGDITED
jgi:staphylococcal nuclease domain-containing protein 1